MRGFGRLIAAATFAALAAGGAAAQDRVVHSIGPTIGTLDPHVNFLIAEGAVIQDLYEGLTTQTADATIIPGAAESWAFNDEGKVLTFRLREGLVWSDGTPLTAQDFRQGLIRTVTPATASDKTYVFTSTAEIVGARAFANGETDDPSTLGIEAPDDRTLVLRFVRPTPFAIDLTTSFFIVPLHGPSYEAHGNAFIRPENLVGNGAFKVKAFSPQIGITLEKNPTYWDADSVALAEVEYRIVENIRTELALWERGEIDTTTAIPVADAARVLEEHPDGVRNSPSLRSNYLILNADRAPFEDANVRRALSLAIDRETLIDKLVRNGGTPSYGITVGAEGYAPAIEAASMTAAEAAEAAKAALAESAYAGETLRFSILTRNDEDLIRIAEGVTLMWRNTLGVEATVEAVDRGTWIARFGENDYDAFSSIYTGDFIGPETYVAAIDPTASTATAYEVPGYTEALGEAMAIVDKSTRWAALAEVEQMLLDTNYLVPMTQLPGRRLVSPRIEGWEMNALGVHLSQHLSVKDD